MAGIDFQETALYHLPGKIIPGNTDKGAFGQDHFKHKLHSLVQAFFPIPRDHTVIFNIFFDDLAVCLYQLNPIHPIRAACRLRLCRID